MSTFKGVSRRKAGKKNVIDISSLRTKNGCDMAAGRSPGQMNRVPGPNANKKSRFDTVRA